MPATSQFIEPPRRQSLQLGTAGTSHQPRSLRAMASERVLNDNRQSLFNVVDKSTAMKNNSIGNEITSEDILWMSIHSSPRQN
jgi:hypothetical protein